MRSSFFIILAACSFDPAPAADPLNPGVDAGLDHDAREAPTYTLLPVTCVPYVYTITHSSTDGSREVTTNEWAAFDLPATADFVVTTCQPTTPTNCGGGNTCTGSTGPTGSGVTCTIARNGLYIENKLTVQCSTRYERFTAAGTLTQATFTAYAISVQAVL